jgi:hypothetical protein
VRFEKRRLDVMERICATNVLVLRNYRCNQTEDLMGLGTILLIFLVLLLVGAIPSWPHSRSWGYGPSGGVGLVLVVVLVLIVAGRI